MEAWALAIGFGTLLVTALETEPPAVLDAFAGLGQEDAFAAMRAPGYADRLEGLTGAELARRSRRALKGSNRARRAAVEDEQRPAKRPNDEEPCAACWLAIGRDGGIRATPPAAARAALESAAELPGAVAGIVERVALRDTHVAGWHAGAVLEAARFDVATARRRIRAVLDAVAVSDG